MLLPVTAVESRRWLLVLNAQVGLEPTDRPHKSTPGPDGPPGEAATCRDSGSPEAGFTSLKAEIEPQTVFVTG